MTPPVEDQHLPAPSATVGPAAADDPVKAAARVSVVSTIGYGAFLCGPPLLGLLAEHVGILHSLLAVLVMLVVSFLLSPVARKLS